ncbi:MAG TPA: molybdopterin-dependent oxidoreductase [Streptosporangiales bacterium]
MTTGIPHSSHWGAFEAVTDGGRFVGVRPPAHDPEPSPIIASIPEMVYDASRVAAPAVRRGWLANGPGGDRHLRGADPFVEVSWDEALDLVAGELRRVRAEFGNEAIFGGSYGWASAGRFHHAKTQLQRFLGCIGGYTGQIHNYSYAAALTLLPHVVGTTDLVTGPLTSWDGIAEHTDLMVCFGGLPLGNTQVEAGGVGEHVAGSWLRGCRTAGVEFAIVSPVRADAPSFLEPTWIGLRPGTDTAFILGVAHTLYAEGRHDEAFLGRYCVGFPVFARYLTGGTDGVVKDADWAASVCGVSADTVRALARRMAAGRTLISGTWSLQRADHGEQPLWAIVTLAAMLGQIGLPGGGFGFGYGDMSGLGAPRRRLRSPALQAGRNPVDSAIPVARIADMLLHPGEAYDFDGEVHTYPDIRLVYWCGGNPFHHHQDLNRLSRAFRRPETVIVHEPWWTATARRADIVLPATTTVERNDIGASARDRYVYAMHKVIEPVAGARDDHRIFTALAHRLGVAETFTENRDERGWLEHLYEQWRERSEPQVGPLPPFTEFWRKGWVAVDAPDQPYVAFEEFRADPERFPLRTPSGRIELWSERVAGFGYPDCPGHACWLEPAEWLGSPLAQRFPLHLVSSQPTTRLHGQLDNAGVSRASKVHGREPVTIHPADAATRGITDGSVVRVFNDRGSTLAGAVVGDAVSPGVVRLATGAWYDPVDPAEPGSLDKHGNPNVLTLDKGTSRLAQAPSAHTTLVEVEAWDGPVPPVTAFRQPDFVAPDQEEAEGV